MKTPKSSNVFYKLLQIGVRSDLPYIELEKTYLFNLFIFIGIAILPILFFINLLKGDYELGILNFFQFSIFLICLFMSVKRKFLHLRMIVIFFASACFFIGSYFFHNGAEYFLFTNIFAALIFCDIEWQFYGYAVLIFSSFTFLKISQANYSDWLNEFRSRSTINMLLVVIILIVIIRFFKAISFNFIDKLEATSKVFETQKNEKEKILKIVAHDLRNPISGILGLSKILLNKENDESNIKSLTLIHDAANNSLEFVNEIMQIQSASDIQIKLTEVDLHKIFEHVIALQMDAIDRKKIQLTLNFTRNSFLLQLDEAKFSRVFSNLIHNAIKFSHIGGQIEINANFIDTSHLMISIKDYGIGIPKKYMPFLFTVVMGSKKRNGTAGEISHGFGLIICKEIIEAHKGVISVISNEGEGSVFNIVLPKIAIN